MVFSIVGFYIFEKIEIKANNFACAFACHRRGGESCLPVTSELAGSTPSRSGIQGSKKHSSELIGNDLVFWETYLTEK